jgi:uncharacterized membrane protein YgaE (UPF0421/DUF939 family)
MAVALVVRAGRARVSPGRGARAAARLEEVARTAGPVLQGTAAATVAWVIATGAFGHDRPFFAAIAAIVALNAPLGRRGGNAVRLLLGVIVGILVGELTLAALGSDTAALALATFAAMALATALDGAPVVIAQAAASAIVTVSVGAGGFGAERLLDALIGAAVALAFSQLLFSPDPVALLRRAEGAALAEMASALQLTARALESDDDGRRAEQAVGTLRRLNDRVADLGAARISSDLVAHRTPLWRSKRRPVERENANAQRLDLLGASCLVLARSAIDTDAGADADGRHGLTAAVRDLSDALGELALAPGDRLARRQAGNRSVDIARRLSCRDPRSDDALWAAVAAVRLVAAAIVMFAGVAPTRADEAVRPGELQIQHDHPIRSATEEPR